MLEAQRELDARPRAAIRPAEAYRGEAMAIENQHLTEAQQKFYWEMDAAEQSRRVFNNCAL